jgi:hypothetical protein
VDVDVDLPSPRRSYANPRVRCDPRGRAFAKSFSAIEWHLSFEMNR